MLRRLLLTLGLLGALACVVMQLNDPDPLRWMAVYGLTAALYAAALFGRGSPAIAGMLALGALLWALRIASRLDDATLALGFDSEELRELGGLALAGLSALALGRFGILKRDRPEEANGR